MEPFDASHFNHNRCKPFLHEGGEKGVLLIHGFTGSVSHMRPLGDALADRGYTVMGINLPGHATTEADMATTDWKQWLDAARKAALTLKKRCKIVTVAGLSMGGLLALILAEEGLSDACVPISAPLATLNRLIRFAGLVSPLKPRVSWAPAEERHQQLDPKFDYGYSGFPTAKAADLQKLIRMARKGLGSIECPVLAIQSTGDKTIWSGSADCVMDGVSSKIKQKLVLQDVPHACTISVELPTIVDAMDRLMEGL